MRFECCILTVPHGAFSTSNENKMSCRERGRMWQRIGGLNSRQTGYYGGSRSAPSIG